MEIWWKGSYLRSLAWMHAAVSEKFEFMDAGRMPDFCATTVALLTKSSKAKNISLKFHDSLKSFGRDPPLEYALFLGSEFDVYFLRRCRLKFFSKKKVFTLKI